VSQFVLVTGGVFLVYLALRVAQMKRSLPFVVAYPLFVLILVGGSVVAFIVASHGAVLAGFRGDDPRVRVAIFGVTAVASLILWLIARFAIGRGK
jgi:hypothetical protein